MRRVELLVAIAVALALAVAGVAAAAKSGGEASSISGGQQGAEAQAASSTSARVSVADETGRRVKHKISTHGHADAGRTRTRGPSSSINTQGRQQVRVREPRARAAPLQARSATSSTRRSARNQFLDQAQDLDLPLQAGFGSGSAPATSYGWAALTSKGKAVDLAPNSRYAEPQDRLRAQRRALAPTGPPRAPISRPQRLPDSVRRRRTGPTSPSASRPPGLIQFGSYRRKEVVLS